jgi:diguanylate cyclase (GGDEF)-like protein
MQAPGKTLDEARRIAALRALNILDTPPEERFDRLTRLAKGLFGVPIALLSLVDENRQWMKSRTGLAVSEIPRDISFCGHAILHDGILLIPDAARDERFHDNLLVKYEPHIRFYAGCPLAAPDGSKLGTLCLIDRVPREFSDDDLALLRDLARIAEQELTAERMATMDTLTQLSNRHGFDTLTPHALDLCRRLEIPAALLFFDLKRLKQINERFGHAEGDHVLRRFARLLKQTFRDPDVPGRIGGDKFAALLANAGRTEANAVLHRLRQTVEQDNRTARRGCDIVFSVSVVAFDAARHADASELLAEAAALMSTQKKQRQEGGMRRPGARQRHEGRRTSPRHRDRR